MARILIIDDDAQIRELLTLFLEHSGYEVMTADDGGKAYTMMAVNPADIVITDILMPEHEGFETIRLLRKEYPGIGIIAISGGGHLPPHHYLEIAQRLGARHTFFKPVDRKTLLNAIQEMLQHPIPG